MAKSLQYAFSDKDNLTTANTTQFWHPFGTMNKNNTEANVQMIMRTAGTLSHFQIKISSNTVNATVVIKIRKNAADTAMTVSIPTTQTGIFEDATNTVSIAAGDKICLTTVPGGGSTGVMGFDYMATLFTPTDSSETVTRLAVISDFLNTNGTDHSAASTTKFYPIQGNMRTSSYAEATIKCRQRHVGKFRNLAIKVRTNTRTTDTIIRLRKNGANATQIITVTATTTGWLEDTTNVDIVAPGDDFNYTVTTGTGSGSFVIDYIAVDFVSTSGYCQLVTATYGVAGDPVSQNSIRELRLAGNGLNQDYAIGRNQYRIMTNATFRFSDLTFLALGNTIDGTSTLKLRKDNGDTSLGISIPPNTSGIFTDSTNLVTTSDTNLMNVQLITGTGSADTITLGVITLYANDLSTSSALNAECDVSDMATDGEFTVNFTTADSIPRHTVWLALSA